MSILVAEFCERARDAYCAETELQMLSTSAAVNGARVLMD